MNNEMAYLLWLLALYNIGQVFPEAVVLPWPTVAPGTATSVDGSSGG